MLSVDDINKVSMIFFLIFRSILYIFPINDKQIQHSS